MKNYWPPSRPLLLLILLSAVIALSACGKTGDLYLADESADSPQKKHIKE
jgi:predicted small lipoprotein YifL